MNPDLLYIERCLNEQFGATDLMSIGLQMIDEVPDIDLFNADELVIAIHYAYFHDEIPFDEWIEYWSNRILLSEELIEEEV